MDFEDISCQTCLYSFIPEDGPTTCRRHAPTITEPIPETDVGSDEEIVPDNFPEVDPVTRCGEGKWVIYDRGRLGAKIVDLADVVGLSVREDTTSMRVHRPAWLDYPQYEVIEEPAKKPAKTTIKRPKNAPKKARTRAKREQQKVKAQSGKQVGGSEKRARELGL